MAGRAFRLTLPGRENASENACEDERSTGGSGCGGGVPDALDRWWLPRPKSEVSAFVEDECGRGDRGVDS